MRRLFRLLAAYVDAVSAAFEKFATEARENARGYSASEYRRGFEDGLRNTHIEAQALQKFRALGVKPKQGLEWALILAAAGATDDLVGIFAQITASRQIRLQEIHLLHDKNIEIRFTATPQGVKNGD
ncbi:hypothetical protein D9V32_13570 [Mycetocola tolaasinivorans]|uniref:Uncharacterized protein n=1 Tax=Mycetocola tolaasinivorans TaxID=76635 RepID=A0A3L7A4Z9_9MICO|nr:hypothetical protein [Mycetocola tolaasinivorans]RLP74372.1 hypothetical protein D9V32_13570 [Mycetocola tolaasinivorans]